MTTYDWIQLVASMFGFALSAMLLELVSAKIGFDPYILGRFTQNASIIPVLFCIILTVALGFFARWVAQWLGA